MLSTPVFPLMNVRRFMTFVWLVIIPFGLTLIMDMQIKTYLTHITKRKELPCSSPL